MSSNLNNKSKKALVWDLSGTFLRQISVLLVSIVLARILDPIEFGIIGMSMVFIAIAEVFTDAGFTSGLIQQKNSKEIAYSSVFYVNLIIGIIVSLLIVISAHYIAVFYEEPRIEKILYFLAVIPPIAAIGQVQKAILTKEINFKSLTIRDLVATLLGGIFGIVAAFSELGVYSLVIQQITMVVVGTAMLWYATGWKPKLEFSMGEIKKLFVFSSYVFADTLLRRVFLKIDTIFIGKYFSPVILGFYSRAESLISQVGSYTTASINKVLFPLFSQIQDDYITLKKTYLRAFSIITGLIILLIGIIYFLANEIIILLFGEKWEQSVIIFKILLLGIIVEPHKGMIGKVILSKGLSKLHFKFGLLARFLRLLSIVGGIFYGIHELALGIVIASFSIFLLGMLLLDVKLKISFWTQLKSFLIPNLVFLIFFIFNFMLPSNSYLNLFCGIAFIICHIFFLMIIKHPSYLMVKEIIQKNQKKISR